MSQVSVALQTVDVARITRRGPGEPGRWYLADTDAGRGLERVGRDVLLLADLGAPPLQEHLPDHAGPGVAACVGELPTHLVARLVAGAATCTVLDMTAGEHALTWVFDGAETTGLSERRFFDGGDEKLSVPAGAAYVVVKRIGL